MTDNILPLIGHFIYFAFLVFLILQTFTNFVLVPAVAIKNGRAWKVNGFYGTYYVVMWALVLTIPTIPALIGV